MIKDKTEFDKTFDEKIYFFFFNLRQVIHIPSFCMANLLCWGDHFRNMTSIDAKNKYRSSYLLDVSWHYL